MCCQIFYSDISRELERFGFLPECPNGIDCALIKRPLGDIISFSHMEFDYSRVQGKTST